MQYELSYYLGKYRLAILVGVVLLVVLCIFVAIYSTYQASQQRRGKLPVAVEVVPRDATVKTNTGEALTSRGEAYLKPGEYKVTVAREGFASQTRDLRVSEDSTPYIYIGLAGKSKESIDWQESHKSEYQRLELLTVEKNREYNTLFKSANPIVNILPIKDPYYSIDYRNYDDKSVELVVWGTSAEKRQAALTFLRKKGYEPTDYRIQYDGYKNPLEAN
ncbi:carboxypeptidase regulatory-like domain-containing protein [Candidatus Saccharibacteria bacterium]|nr:carboxypeptidase regulatory-like domain-containing protein [Candidatus Saccharibacteria bacterium]